MAMHALRIGLLSLFVEAAATSVFGEGKAVGHQPRRQHARLARLHHSLLQRNSPDAQAPEPLEGVEVDSEKQIPVFRPDGKFQVTTAKGDVSVATEVPRTFSKFMEGMMWRKTMTDDQAMIFQWNADAPRGFWMENTYVGLDMIFVDHTGKIVDIKEGKPLELRSVESSAPASYCVEVPAGWAKRHGVNIGDAATFSIDSSSQYYVATDAADFGASPEEIAIAVADGNYQRPL